MIGRMKRSGYGPVSTFRLTETLGGRRRGHKVHAGGLHVFQFSLSSTFALNDSGASSEGRITMLYGNDSRRLVLLTALLPVLLLVLPAVSSAQTGTLTDDATFPTSFPAKVLTVQGSSATGGAAASFIKFKLTPN